MKLSIFFLAAILFPVALEAQERGMLMESGAWQTPNPTTALRALMEQAPGSTAEVERRGHCAVVAADESQHGAPYAIPLLQAQVHLPLPDPVGSSTEHDPKEDISTSLREDISKSVRHRNEERG